MNTIENNAVNVDNQREVINEMRRDGSLLSSINETLQANEGVATRGDIIKGVIDASGLTQEVAIAMHLTTSGTNRNTLQSVVDYVATDMKAGMYGVEAANLETDGTGVWVLDCVIDITKAKRVFAKHCAKTKEAKAELRTKYKKELAHAFKLLSDNAKAAFKAAGGTMEKTIIIMFETGATAEEAIASF